MNTMYRNISTVLMVGILLAVVFASSAVAGETYTTVAMPDLNTDISTWSDGGSYNTIFPGDHTWNGVPFSLVRDQSHNEAYMGDLSIPVGVYGVTKAYSLINSEFGYYGTGVGYMNFYGSDGAYYQMALTEGLNVRDHFYGNFNNTIDNVTAIAAWDNGWWRARLDMQVYVLPADFATQTLDYIEFDYQDMGYSGRPFLAGITVVSNSRIVPTVPVPGAFLLVSVGLTGLAAMRRRLAK